MSKIEEVRKANGELNDKILHLIESCKAYIERTEALMVEGDGQEILEQSESDLAQTHPDTD